MSYATDRQDAQMLLNALPDATRTFTRLVAQHKRLEETLHWYANADGDELEGDRGRRARMALRENAS